MIKYPFHKLLLYLAAISKFDRYSLAEKLDLYLPTIIFEDGPVEYVKQFIKDREKPVPACIMNGGSDPSALRLYCSVFKLGDLHSVFNSKDFEDLMFDIEWRRQIDAMLLSPAFRSNDVLREFPQLNRTVLDVYNDCVANFAPLRSKDAYIALHIGDERERKLMNKVLRSTSRATLRLILGLKGADPNPIEIMNRSLNIAAVMTDDALLDGESVQIERWVKLQATLAERLHNMGVGTKSDLEEFISALKAEPTYEDPKIYTKEELEDMCHDRGVNPEA